PAHGPKAPAEPCQARAARTGASCRAPCESGCGGFPAVPRRSSSKRAGEQFPFIISNHPRKWTRSRPVRLLVPELLRLSLSQTVALARDALDVVHLAYLHPDDVGEVLAVGAMSCLQGFRSQFASCQRLWTLPKDLHQQLA